MRVDLDLLTKNEFYEYMGYSPHLGQQQMHDCEARFRSLACGVRWGKSLSAAYEILDGLRVADSRYWITAPTLDLTEKVFRELYGAVFNSPLKKYVESESYREKRIKFVWDAEVFGKTTDNLISLAGEELNGVVMDEAPASKREAWEMFIRQRLTDRKGWALFIGTPKGRNWYYNMYTRGLDKKERDYKSFHFTSYANPYLEPAEIDIARTQIPDRAFRQEYLAEFLQEQDAVFRNIREAIVPNCLCKPKEGRVYVGGLDLAKYQDFNVLIIMDKGTKQVVYKDRWNRTSWKSTYDRIAKGVNLYGASVWVDSTGIGDPIYDTLMTKPYSLRVKPFKFTNASKGELVDNLAWFFENEMVGIPDWEEMISELTIFEYTKSKTGRYIFNAPEGYHDDIVIGLGLACMGLSRGKTSYVGSLDLSSF